MELNKWGGGDDLGGDGGGETVIRIYFIKTYLRKRTKTYVHNFYA